MNKTKIEKKKKEKKTECWREGAEKVP